MIIVDMYVNVFLGNLPATGDVYGSSLCRLMMKGVTSLQHNFYLLLIHSLQQQCRKLFNLTLHVPYSGKFSREKTFAKTTNRKISRRKLSRIHTIDRI